jgi:hypothetical protein
MVVIVVAVAMAPVPVFFLPFGRQFAEIYVFVVVPFASPLIVINNFVVVPDVVIAVIGVVNPVGMVCATRAPHG